jgi:hypothetical protein
MDDLSIVLRAVEDPAPGWRDALDATAALRLWLLTGRTAREPQSALTDARIMSRRDAKPRPILVIADDNDA